MNDHQLSRREALKRVIGLSVALSALEMPAFANTPVRGIGTDPNLLKKEIPWPLVLTEAEMKTVTVLGDIIIPADEHGPAASAVGVPEFIDEWVSAPYEQQQGDLVTLRKGLAWLDAESKKRFTKIFVEITPEQQIAMIDDIVKEGTDARKQAYQFLQAVPRSRGRRLLLDARGLEGDRLHRQRADAGISRAAAGSAQAPRSRLTPWPSSQRARPRRSTTPSSSAPARRAAWRLTFSPRPG